MAIRVLLAELPRIMREIVELALGDAPDMEVVGAVGRLDALAGPLAAAHPDVLVVGLRDEHDAPRLDHVLYAMPRLVCLAIAGDARRAFLYELRPQATPLGEVSPLGIVEAIRTSQHAGTR